MELLILMALACWGGGRYLVHTPQRIAERRQRASQTHQLRMQRLAQRQGPTIAQAISTRIADRIANPRGGPAREAIALWWSDSWGYATERRLRRHERAEAGQLHRQRAARAAKTWLATQWADLTGADDTTGGSRTSGPVRAEAHVSPGPDDDTDIVDAEIVEEDPNSAPAPTGGAHTVNDDTTSAQPSTKASHAEDRSHTQPSPADQPTTTDPGDPPHAGDPGPDPNLEHEDDRDGPMASVHPLHTNRKDFTVSTPTSTTITSGETLDPSAARAFSCGVEEAAQQIHSQIELSVTSLTGCGVSGEPIEDLVGMQEAASMLVDRARSATAHFDRHLAAQDQVLADPTLAGTVEGTYFGRG